MAQTIINHDIRSVGGATIYMPAYYNGEVGWQNMALPNTYNADDATAQYPRGAKFVEGERVFYYGKYLGQFANDEATSVTATNGDDLAGRFLFTSAIQQDMATGLLVRCLQDETAVVYNTTVDDGSRADDWLSGGWMSGKDTAPADERFFWRRIVKHDYQATGSKVQEIWNASNEAWTTVDLSSYTYCSVLELDQPLINSKTSMATTLLANPWKNVVDHPESASEQYSPAMGVCMHNNVTAAYNTWFQTWGPFFSGFITNAAVGGANFEVIYYVMGDGSIQGIDGSTDTYGIGEGFRQIAGVSYANTAYEGGSGADELLPVIYCTLKP